MELSIGSRFKNAWNAFANKNPTSNDYGYNGYYYRPDRIRLTTRNERSIITSVFNINKLLEYEYRDLKLFELFIIAFIVLKFIFGIFI